MREGEINTARNRTIDRYALLLAKVPLVERISPDQHPSQKRFEAAVLRRNPHDSPWSKTEAHRGIRVSAQPKPIPVFLGGRR
jgi:hypothetical protein